MRRIDGVAPKDLDDDEVRTELHELYRTREDTFLNGSKQALDEHTSRMFELEKEFLRRFPREVRPVSSRTRSGARAHRRVRGTKATRQPTTRKPARASR